MHLEIIVDRLKREFSVEASVGKPQVAYKETVTRPSEGEGKWIGWERKRGRNRRALRCIRTSFCGRSALAGFAAGTRALCVISAGFAEVGAEGARRQDALVAAVRAHGARLIGPNCLGIAVSGVSLNATFGPRGAVSPSFKTYAPERCALLARARLNASLRRASPALV